MSSPSCRSCSLRLQPGLSTRVRNERCDAPLLVAFSQEEGVKACLLPDVDQVYMTICQMLTGTSGWPPTMIMTPAGKPFFAGAFFPEHGRFQRPGLMELIPRISLIWKERPADLESSAVEITSHLERALAPGKAGSPGPSTLDEAHRQLFRRFEVESGGLGAAPKFPSPHNLVFLLRSGGGPALRKR